MKSVAEAISRIRADGLAANRSLGQHFLMDEPTIEAIADAAAPPNSIVLEIGPGPGVLTVALCARARRVVALEVDRGMAPYLEAVRDAMGNLDIVYADAERADWGEVLARYPADSAKVLAGNLPYYITTSLLEKALNAELPIKSATFLIQKEAAERLMASPGTREYGPLGVLLGSRGEAEPVLDVPPGAFKPPPKVVSRAVRINMRPCDPALQRSLTRAARAAFAHRRKTLQNGLSAALSLPQSAVAYLLSSINIPAKARAEELTPSQFAALARALDAIDDR